VRTLRKHQLIPSMSRPANPYDNASCESFMKTLKREEIYANQYRDLDHLRTNINQFIDGYYNRCRLHSALGYRPPQEFEQMAAAEAIPPGATMSFFRHREIFRSDRNVSKNGKPAETGSPTHRLDESPAGYSSAGCSPAEPASASPAMILRKKILFEKEKSLNGRCSYRRLSQRRGPPHFDVVKFVAVGCLRIQQGSTSYNKTASTV
jgi:hypothetical protein